MPSDAHVPCRRRLMLAGLSALATMAARRARAADDSELYEKAKAEGALVLYAGGPTAPWEETAERFNRAFPGIKVSISGGFSNVLDLRIEEQLKAGRLEVDMAVLQTLQDFVAWARRGVLLRFKPEGFDRIDPQWKDPDGAYTGLAVNAHPYAYNSRLVRPEDVPRSAPDFLRPVFRGKVIACYPQDDDATLYAFWSVVEKYGWSWMEAYMANDPVFIQGHLGVVRSISAGQTLVTLDTIANMTRLDAQTGKPQDLAFSEVDPLPVWPLCGAIFREARHPNAAKLFMNFYLTPAQQVLMGSWSSRSDVPPPDGLKPLASYRLYNRYREFLTDEPQLLALRRRFGEMVGPIRNTGGVR